MLSSRLCVNFNLLFFILHTHYFVNRCNSQFIFETEIIDYVYQTTATVQEPQVNYFSNLDPREQHALCNRARLHAFADIADTRRVSARVDKLGVRYLDETNHIYIALSCPTIPRLYLRIAPNQITPPFVIKVMERRNEFLDTSYQFYPKIVEAIILIGEFSEETLNECGLAAEPKPYLIDRSDYERQKMCIAAKRHLNEVNGLEIIILPQENIEIPKVYHIVYKNGLKANVIAFKCNTIWQVHLCIFDDSRPDVFSVIFSEQTTPTSSDSVTVDLSVLSS